MTTDLTLVPAGAGSGKTYRIEKTLAKWVADNKVRADRILAVTFTEAAASDMKERIRARLLQEGKTDEALALDRAYVGTIHALGQRLLTEQAFAAGRAPTLRLLEDAERDLLIRGQIGKAEALRPIAENLARFGYRFDQKGSGEDAFRGKILSTIDLLRGLGTRGSSLDMVEGVEADLRADYGETQDPAEMTAALHLAATNLLSTFPNGIADEVGAKTIKRRLRAEHSALKKSVETDALSFDWSLWQKLRDLWVSTSRTKTPDKYDALAEAVMDAADGLPHHPGPLEDTITHITALVTGAQEIMAAYSAEKRARGLIDYADMIADTERMLREKPRVLEAVLGEIDCVVIDEFQDTNPVQFALLWRLAHRAPRALIVGDRKQAIMGFQGADPRLSAALDSAYSDALDPLLNNWRSVPDIMKFVNSVGLGLFPDGYDALAPKAGPAKGTTLGVLSLEGKLDHKFACIADYIQKVLDSERTVIDRSTKQQRQIEARDIAVLCYTKSHAQKAADALCHLGLSVHLPETGWYEGLAVDMARAALAIIANPKDRYAALNLATRGPDRVEIAIAFHGAKDDTLDAARIIAILTELAPSLRNQPVAVALSRALAEIDLFGWAQQLPDGAQATADLGRLLQEAQNFDTAVAGLHEAAGFHGASIDVFLGWISDVAARGEDSRPDPDGWVAPGIEISTWHSAKGREWPVTIVAGWDKKILDTPHTLRAGFANFDDLDDVLSRAQLDWHAPYAAKEHRENQARRRQKADEEAAARAIYVALTRARESLILALPATLPKEKERPMTMFELLRESTGFALGDGAIAIGDEKFPAMLRSYPKDLELAEGVHPPMADRRRFGISRDPVSQPATLWRATPSAGEIAPTQTLPQAEHTDYSNALPICARGLDAAHRGTAFHLAFRTLFTRPDARDRLAVATNLNDEELTALAGQVVDLKNLLKGMGYSEFHSELPFQSRSENGAEVNAIIDLLAEGPDGLAIIDHKTGKCSDLQDGLAQYWPQLSSYRDLVAARWPEKPLRHLAINWMDEGKISFITEPTFEVARR